MGPGYNCMNDLVVLQTAQVEISWYCDCRVLLNIYLKNLARKPNQEVSLSGIQCKLHIITSYDHRASGALSSKPFYEITVKVSKLSYDITIKVFQTKGIKVYGFHQFAFTPLVVGVCISSLLSALFYFNL